MVNDVIGDTIARLYNASVRKKRSTEVLYTKRVIDLLEVLKRRGFIDSYEIDETEKFKKIIVKLVYEADRRAKITSVRRVSKPGCRIYRRKSEVKKVMQGRGIGVYSTSLGVMSDKEAYLKSVGGEYWCELW